MPACAYIYVNVYVLVCVCVCGGLDLACPLIRQLLRQPLVHHFTVQLSSSLTTCLQAQPESIYVHSKSFACVVQLLSKPQHLSPVFLISI